MTELERIFSHFNNECLLLYLFINSVFVMLSCTCTRYQWLLEKAILTFSASRTSFFFCFSGVQQRSQGRCASHLAWGWELCQRDVYTEGETKKGRERQKERERWKYMWKEERGRKMEKGRGREFKELAHTTGGWQTGNL